MNDLQLYHLHKAEVADLKKTIRLLQVNNCIWKAKYFKLLGKKPVIKRVSRSANARVYVQAWIDGDKSLSFREIADKFFLSYATIKTISHHLQKDKKNENIDTE